MLASTLERGRALNEILSIRDDNQALNSRTSVLQFPADPCAGTVLMSQSSTMTKSKRIGESVISSIDAMQAAITFDNAPPYDEDGRIVIKSTCRKCGESKLVRC